MKPARSGPGWSESIWFANDGGPLIVLPREHLASWRGATRPFEDASRQSDDDYERACAAEYPGELIEVGDRHGLVIGAQDHACPAHWVRLPPFAAPLLVGWSYGEEGATDEVYALLGSSTLKWARQRHTQRVASGELVLFHAASAGGELSWSVEKAGRELAVIGDAIPTSLPPGEYAVEVIALGGDLDRDSFGCVACRWIAA